MTARKGKPKQNSPNGTSKTGQEIKACSSEMPDRLPGQDCQDRTARAGLQCRSAKTRLPGHDIRDRRARADMIWH